MRLLRSLIGAALVAIVIWMLGGPWGAWLNAPGLLLLRGASALGLRIGDDPSLRSWLWLGTLASVVMWWLAFYVALGFVERKGSRA